MGRTRITYQRQPDPASQAQRQASAQAVQQRQIQASQYAAARFQEWAAGAQDREALLNARLQNAQSDAEMNGAQLRYNFWKDNELRNQTTHYYTAMPQLQEQLRQNGIYPGSARYAAEMSAFASTIPDALTHNDAIRKDLQGYAKVDDNAARINEMMDTQKISQQQAQMQAAAQDAKAMGQNVSSFSTSSKGVDIKATRPTDQIPTQAMMRYGKLVGDVDEFATSDPSRVSAAQKEKTLFENRYPGLKQLLPAPSATPSPSPTPDQSGLNPVQKFLVATGIGKAPEAQPTPTPSPTPDQTPVPYTTQVPAVSGQPPALDDIFGAQQQTP